MKNKHEKIKLLQGLSEDSLRQEVLIPLLSKLGFIDPIHHHHPNEKGKDIICKEYDPVFKKTKYIAVVVKKGNITGSSSSSDGYFNVINQVKQALNEPYKHVYELREVSMDSCLLIASGKFLATSLDSIYRTLRQERLDKLIRDAIDIDKLASLIDENYPELWNEYETERESLVKQRNALLNNIAKLIKLIIPSPIDQKKALTLISNADTNLEMFKLSPLNKFTAHIGYGQISIDAIDEYYTDKIVNHFGDSYDIKQRIYSIKKEAQAILSDFTEVAYILEDILKAEDPIKVIDHCLKFVTIYNDRQTFLHEQDEFYYALMHYKDKKEFLIEKNLLGIFRNIMLCAEEKVTKALINFYKKYPNDIKNKWLGCKIVFSSDPARSCKIDMYEFEKEVTEKEIEKYKVIRNNGCNEIVIEIAVNRFGLFREEQRSFEAKARDTLWHFTYTIDKEFFLLNGYE